eukprot:TRINITY_DN69_c0_g2_i1.p2 TRINITY_DN69_c0_g2~~TRINITY_DN69_c0_g2_i1.p2  ORF type:complete len:157 (+),score=26.74 TRINITY_DN69_c0_g2_i1:23-472(+)
MPSRLRHNRKKRGHTQMGYGKIGKHRKHPAGRGKAGGQHHMRTWFDRYHPGYFGKVGDRKFNYKQHARWQPSVNIDSLQRFVGTTDAKIAAKDPSKLPVVDLTKLGRARAYRVLGNGHINRPLIVKARAFTRRADEKIRKAGGVAVIVA